MQERRQFAEKAAVVAYYRTSAEVLREIRRSRGLSADEDPAAIAERVRKKMRVALSEPGMTGGREDGATEGTRSAGQKGAE